MVEELHHLLNNAYSVYFNYPVACILVCKDNKKFYGVNVETSSPGAGICAERNALYSAISNGYKKGDFKELYIMNKTNKYSYPCFICRQALNDLCDTNTKIILYTYDGIKKEVMVSDLCPYPFNEDNLK